MQDFDAGRLEEIAVVDGYCVDPSHDENVWIETWDGRRFTVDGEGRSSLTTPALEGRVCAIFDEGFIEKTGEIFRLFDAKGVEVTALSVPPVPRSLYASGYPQYDGGWYDAENKRYWYAGYGTTGDSLLYLIDPLSLSIVSSVSPKAYHWDKELLPWTVWGDEPRWVPGPDWIGLTSNTGDSFDYFCRYRESDDAIESLHHCEIEMAVRCASDEVVWHVGAVADSIVACDDLGFLTLIDGETGDRIKGHASPFDPWLKDGAICVSRYEEQPRRNDYELMELVTSSTHVFIDAQINPYGTGPMGDFPPQILFMLDSELKTVAAFDPKEADLDSEWQVHQNGIVAAMKEGRTTLFKWTT